MPEREGTFYPVWPNIDGKNLNMQWGEIRSNTAETKAIVRNSVQDLQTGVDELNALRSLLGLEFGDLDFRSKFRFFYNKTTFELCCQKNDGTVDSPTWIDAWCVRFTDGQFQAVGTGGIQSDAGFYGPGLSSLGEIGETGTAADNTILNPTKLFFNADDGLNVITIPSGGNAGSPEIRFTQPFGRAETFDQLGREWIVQHNFDASPVMVQVYDDDDRVIFPDKADVSDPNIAYFYFHAATTGKVTIATGGTGAASLVPKDPFYLVVRTDGQAADSHTLDPNADLIFDSTQFYVNVDLDTDTGGSHKKAFVSLLTAGADDHGGLLGLTDDDHTQYSLVDGSRAYTGTLQGNLGVDQAVKAEAFYVASGANFHGNSPGNITLDGFQLLLPDGDMDSPALSFASGLNSGMFKDGSGDLNFVRDAATELTITAGSISSPANSYVGPNGSVGAPSFRGSGSADTGMWFLNEDVKISSNAKLVATFGHGGMRVDERVVAEAFYVASGGELNDAQWLTPDGATAAPGIAFVSNPDTGMSLDGTGLFQFSKSGSLKMRITDTAVVFIDQLNLTNGSVGTPSIRFGGSDNTGIYLEGFSTSANLGLVVQGKEVTRFGKNEVRFTDAVAAEAFYLTTGGDLAETWVSFDIPGPAIDNYFIDTAGAAYQIDEVSVQTSTGSATVAFYIHQDGERFPGVSVGALDPISASSTRTTITATSDFTTADGDELIMSVPSNSFATHLRGRVKIRRLE